LVSRGKIVVTAAFIGLGLGMLGLVYYASLDNPHLEMVQLELVDVKVLETNSIDKRATLEITFLITNPSEKTFTISNINYELFVNNNDVGNGEYSTEDIAMPGRAAIYAGNSVELSSKFNLVYTDQIADEYSIITNSEEASFRVKGIASIESAWSIVEKPFDVTLG
jgi:LEA14-like dessication related protein